MYEEIEITLGITPARSVTVTAMHGEQVVLNVGETLVETEDGLLIVKDDEHQPQRNGE